MDLLYGHGTKMNYLDEQDMVDLMDSNDMFHNPMTIFPTPDFPTPDDEGFENDWLKSFLDDPVLNDKMMTDAMQPPCIKSEHSYSINNELGSPLGFINQEDMDSDLFSNTSALDLTMKSMVTFPVKSEATSPDMFLTSADSTLAYSITRQPTIIVTTTSTPMVTATSSIFGSETISIPTIQIKQEPAECLDQMHEQTVNLESIVLPPTPPGSSGSDSEGSQSPQQSAPSSPIRQTSFRHSASATQVTSKGYTQPLFVNAISQSGLLILSEEEKRTLVSEGYPIPTKLPLTKQEEKNLKKIRRKIKNKISAQESRRKKKEYLEALEKRIEAYNHENNDLKKKVENLESNNRSLLGQLQKLQSLVSKMPKAATATQTGTALMVLVFCFAVFLGSMSPSNLNIGYSTKPPMLGFVQSQPNSLPQPQIGPQPLTTHDTSSPYVTPNIKSRVLMSVNQEDNCDDFRAMPWENSMSCPMVDSVANKNADLPDPGVDLLGGAEIPIGGKTTPDAMVVMVVAASVEANNSDSRENMTNAYHHNVLPDVGMIHKEMLQHGRLHNMTVEMETA